MQSSPDSETHMFAERAGLLKMDRQDMPQWREKSKNSLFKNAISLLKIPNKKELKMLSPSFLHALLNFTNMLKKLLFPNLIETLNVIFWVSF